MSGLLAIAARFGPQLRLYELGASAGLNLQLDRYAYDLGGRAAGRSRLAAQAAAATGRVRRRRKPRSGSSAARASTSIPSPLPETASG